MEQFAFKSPNSMFDISGNLAQVRPNKTQKIMMLRILIPTKILINKFGV